LGEPGLFLPEIKWPSSSFVLARIPQILQSVDDEAGLICLRFSRKNKTKETKNKLAPISKNRKSVFFSRVGVDLFRSSSSSSFCLCFSTSSRFLKYVGPNFLGDFCLVHPHPDRFPPISLGRWKRCKSEVSRVEEVECRRNNNNNNTTKKKKKD
jgi:hypothetical protein